jgi:hypothetical protein
MAKLVIVSGGFADAVAAESLLRDGPGHQIKPMLRQQKFTFFPLPVRLAFG